MKFPFGFPEQYELQHRSPSGLPPLRIVEMDYSPKGNVVAILTPQRLYLWSCFAHYVQLASLGLPLSDASSKQKPQTDEKNKEPASAVGLIWHPAGRTIAVATSDRRILYFEVDVNTTSSNSIAVDGSSGVLSVGEAASRICFTLEVQLDAGMIIGLCASKQYLFVTTTAGFVLTVGWSSGAIVQCFTAAIFLRDIKVASTSSQIVVGGAVTFFEYSAKSQKFCVLLADGTVCVLRSLCADLSSPKLRFEGLCCPGIGSECAALNARHSVVAVGCSNCDVVFVSIGEELLKPLSSVRQTIVGESLDSLGSISSLRWSPDEECLLVAFANRGVALFDPFGVCLATTFSRSPVVIPAMGSLSHLRQNERGCVCAAWDTSGSRIAYASPQHPTSFFAMHVAQVAASSQRDDATFSSGSLTFFTASQVLFLHPSDAEGVAFGWETITAPPEYLSGNYPLRYCSSSPDGANVVVAGRTGCALYSDRLHRWRLFGDQSQEENLSCVCSPKWIQNVVIALPVRNRKLQEFQIILFPRNHLDSSSALCTIDLPKRPFLVACGAGHSPSTSCLVVADASAEIAVYSIAIGADDLLRPSSFSATVMAKTICILPDRFAAPLCVSVCPTGPLRRPIQPPATPFDATSLAVLRRDHRLCVVTMHDRCWEELQSEVSSLWVDGSARTEHAALRIILTSGKQGVVLHWAEVAGPTPSSGDGGIRRNKNFAITVAENDGEFSPIGMLPSEGIVVLGSGRVFGDPSIPSVLSHSNVDAKATPFRHAVLLPLFIAQSNAADSVEEELLFSVARCLRDRQSFVPTMDFLVHLVLEECDCMRLEGKRVVYDRRRALQCIVRFLRKYRECHEIVVGSLRKTDDHGQRVLFDVIGSAQDWYNECVANCQINEAVHAVRVMLSEQQGDAMKSLETACANSRKIFGAVLRYGDAQTAYELLRFIALLSCEIDLPPTGSLKNPLTAIERAIRSVWPLVGKEEGGSFHSRHSRAEADDTGGAAGRQPSGSLRAVQPRQSGSGAGEQRELLQKVFSRYTDISNSFKSKAAELLHSGRLSQFCELFYLFNLDVPHFIGSEYRGATLSEKLFATLHQEFSLPRCPQGEIILSPNVKPSAESHTNPTQFLSDATQQLLSNSLQLFTATQEHLLACEDTLNALHALLKLFTFHNCDEYVLLLSVLLVRVTAIQRLLVDRPAWGPQLEKILSEPSNAGYKRLAAAVLGSITPEKVSPQRT